MHCGTWRMRGLAALVAGPALVGLWVATVQAAAPAWGSAAATPTAASTPWSFEAIPDPAAGTNPLPGSVSCVLASCVAVGRYDDRAGTNTPLTEIWTGGAWRIAKAPAPPSGFGGQYSGVSCTGATNCLAVGLGYDDFDGFTDSPLAARWNGSTWTGLAVPKPAGTNTTFSSVSCATSTACVAVGDSLNPRVIPQTDHPLAAQWNGSTWTFHRVPVPSGVTSASLLAVSCPTANHCTAVGSYSTPKFTATLPLVESWDGTQWTLRAVPIASGAYSTTLSDVSCPATTNCTAVGRSYATPGAPATPLVESWDGSAWQLRQVPGTPTDTALAAVSCPTPTGCVAVGASNATTQRNTALAVRLTGGRWQVEPTAAPASGRTLAGVSCTSGGCQAVGWTLTDPAHVAYSALAERRV